MKSKLLLSISFMFVFGALQAQDLNTAKLDSLFTSIIEHQEGRGSVSIFHEGKEIYTRSIGYADIETEQKANGESRYGIGSISKTFTAVLIMRLVEEGKLKLDSRLSEFVPEIENAKDITIEHLLRHRSGIFNFTSDPDYDNYNEEAMSREDMVSLIKKLGSNFKPGEKFEYSNSGYVLLSYIIEDASGKSFDDMLQEYICKPCALSSIALVEEESLKNNFVKSYVMKDDWQAWESTHHSIALGAGSIVSNPTDLNRFINCLFKGDLVKKENLDKMMEMVDGYGYGMFSVPFNEKSGFGHTGGIDGFQSNCFYFPEDKLSVSYLSNGTKMLMNDVLIGVLSIYFDLGYTIPDFKPGIVLTQEQLDQYVGLYTSPDIPLAITVSRKDNTLQAQATGQNAFDLQVVELHEFKFDPAAIKMSFDPENAKMILKQAGMEFNFVKE